MPQPETSKLAHEKVKSNGSDKTHAEIIYQTLLNRPNKMGTASDIATFSKLDYVEVNRRISELLAAQRIEIMPVKGKTGNGNACRVYRALTDQPLTETPKTQGDLFS